MNSALASPFFPSAGAGLCGPPTPVCAAKSSLDVARSPLDSDGVFPATVLSPRIAVGVLVPLPDAVSYLPDGGGVLLLVADTSLRVGAGALLPTVELFPLVHDIALLFTQILVPTTTVEPPLVRISFTLLADTAPLPV